MNEIDNQTQEAAPCAAAEAEGRGKIISIDEGRIKEHLSGVVLEAVEETLNALLNAEADAAVLRVVDRSGQLLVVA